MKTLLIESCEKIIKDNSSSIVHVRNSVLIKDYIGCDFVSHESQIDSVKNNKYDVIICAYGSPYMKYNKYLEILHNNPNAKMYWLVNDHDVEDNILLRKWLIKYNKPYHMICNNPREGYRGWILRKNMNGKKLNDWIDEWHTLNLNTIIFDENTYQQTKLFNEKKNILYYGTFRKFRVKDMALFNDADYYLSSSKKNHEKYKNAGIKANYIERIIWEEKEADMFEPVGLRLKDFLISMYLEDEHTHENYAFMANRFYEGVMNNTLLAYDAKCQLTLNKSGYAIHPKQIVCNGKELMNFYDELIKNSDLYQEILNMQQSNVPKILQEKHDCLESIKRLCSGSI